MSREAVKVIGDVLQSELGLTTGQIMLTNMKWDIPENDGLYVALSYVSGKAIGNNNYVTPNGSGMQETQEVAMRYLVQIDILSFGDAARLKKEQVIQALMSVASQQAQAQNLMRIANIPFDFLDASSFEETKLLNRYVTRIVVYALLSLTKNLDSYYDKFPVTFMENAETVPVGFEAETKPSF